jgi:small conductance mechanosensitive channel
LAQVLANSKLKLNKMLNQIFNATNTSFINKWIDMLMAYAPKLVGAVIIYLVGSFVIKKLLGVIGNIMKNKSYDKSLQGFLLSTLKVVLMLMLILTTASMIGIDITSFAALLAGAGLAIGAALNGSLGNLAGGVMILIFKPFKINDLIEAQGVIGTVIEQGIFATTILSPDSKTVILPNGPLSTGIITNYTTHGNLRVDLNMAIALDQSIDTARSIAIEAMLSHTKVLRTPMPEVSVLKVGDGMCTLAIRPYTTQSEYWNVYFGVQELVKKAWDTNKISGPTPTRIIINKA